MVHALEEIRRILVPAGCLIDLRPIADRWPVEVASGLDHRVVGRLTDLPSGLADDEAADKAIREAARRGWFVRESESIFPFLYIWDTPGEMRNYIQEMWTDFLRLEADTFSAAQSAWEAQAGKRQVRVRRKMLLTRWRKNE